MFADLEAVCVSGSQKVNGKCLVRGVDEAEKLLSQEQRVGDVIDRV